MSFLSDRCGVVTAGLARDFHFPDELVSTMIASDGYFDADKYAQPRCAFWALDNDLLVCR
jgi:hypothetical protein